MSNKKYALVIGGTSGIGLGVARTLSHKDIITYIVGRRDFNEQNNAIIHIQVDLTSTHAIQCILDELSNVKLDYVVFSAATEAPLMPFAQTNPEEYDYAFSLNLKVPFFLTKALLKNLNQNARLLFITSRLSSSPEAGSLVYCMTKSAIEVFSAGLNKELQGKILASSIIPGIVDTEMQKRLREADPTDFPHTHLYQKMESKLLAVNDASNIIVSHLCDTDNINFITQKVDLSRLPIESP